MSDNRWLGGAVATAMTVTITISSYDASTTYKISIGSKTVSVVGSGGTTTTVATALTAALVASLYGEFLEVTWTSNAAIITGVANTAGKPFTATSSVSGGTGTIGAVTTTVANTGPNDYSTTLNWSLGVLPVNSDNVWIDNNSYPILYGLGQSAVTLTSLNIAQSFAAGTNGNGTIGLPKVNADSATAYPEYRPDYLQIGATTISIGYDAGIGSGRIKIDTGSVQTNLLLSGSGTGIDSAIGLEPVLWKGTHASNAVRATGGTLGVAVFGGEVATIATLQVANNAQVRTTAGVTLTTLTQAGSSSLEVATAFTTLTQLGGNSLVRGTGNATTMNVYRGSCFVQTNGTITTLVLGPAGIADFTQDLRSRTVTNATMYAGSALLDGGRTITHTNPILLAGCGIEDVTIDKGKNINAQFTFN